MLPDSAMWYLYYDYLSITDMLLQWKNTEANMIHKLANAAFGKCQQPLEHRFLVGILLEI
jgi:hypothetical protein